MCNRPLFAADIGRVAFDIRDDLVNTRHRLRFAQRLVTVQLLEYFMNTESKEPTGITLEPIYIRLSDAEINYSQKFGKPM